VPSSLGNNITRLGISVGVALALALALTVPRARLIAVAAMVPIFLGQWQPASSALRGVEGSVGVTRAYYQPLLRFLASAGGPRGRVEVVPTALHWESLYVALHDPIARGWERQLDTAENPIFYRLGPLRAASYRAWLRRNGVRFVALPDARLDYAARAEGRLVRRGVPGLRLAWRNAHWRVYAVTGSPGIVSGAALLGSAAGATATLEARRAGRILVRIHYATEWHVRSGAAGDVRDARGWIALRSFRAGPITLAVSLPG
jgi:hypothetical protein